jgi:hypothetical protein
MDAEGQLRLEYDQAIELIRTLTDTRFKLLALVPTIAGAAVGLLGSPRSAAELLAVGLLGLSATVGILLYDLRNTQIVDAMLLHAQALEQRLGLQTARGSHRPDTVLSQFAPPHERLFGIVTVGQERALGLVYGAALGGWSYLVAWGALRALHFEGARVVGGLIGALSATAVAFEVQRFGNEAGQRIAGDADRAGQERDHLAVR